ncbi:sugar ABC transporter ATP-binding protein [Actinocorallia herbida]|uniref:sugar ABC transporter ATP-binding protein n=1 Tax=Actinocorallia herbida TaxID=58109 RepID=UPI001476EF4F|nr:sugar ABC transporter ATP-binding protein [Actinocorallia herbida]
MTYVLDADHVSKRFGGAHALADAALRVRQGTVHALLGGNGSGKSTMIKCLAGVHSADAGTVRLHGREIKAENLTSSRARAEGLRFVHQDLGLFDSLTVAENFALDAGFPVHQLGGIRWRALRSRVGRLLERHELAVSSDTLVGALRPATKTMVAVVRALQDQEGTEHILMLDEPTASLPDAESRALMDTLRRRAAAGQTIVLVSHRLQEVLAVADDFTIFRDGRVVSRLEASSPSENELIELMVGEALSDEEVSPATISGERVLELSAVVAGPLTGLDLEVTAGEIVGLAGPLGSGRSTALSVIFGSHTPSSGEVRVGGQVMTGRTVAEMMRAGVALVPQDRGRDAAWPAAPVAENMTLSVLGRYFSGWMRDRASRADARDLIGRFAIKTPSVAAPLSALSGGNQQKVVLARWLRRDPTVLLLDEPTQGVDVRSRADIYRHIREVASRGCGVLVASSDFEELVRVCDRVVVLADGKAGPSLPVSGLSANRITELVQKGVRL